MRHRHLGFTDSCVLRRNQFVILGLLLFVAIVSASSLLGAACVFEPIETHNSSHFVGDSPKLIINNEHGFIRINKGPDNEIAVQVELQGSGDIDCEVIQDGDTIILNTETNRRWGPFGTCQVDVTINTPYKTDIELETSDGLIEIDGIECSGPLKTSNGDIILRNVKGDIDAETRDGDIGIHTLEGNMRLRNVNGELNLQEVTGEIDAATSNGEIKASIYMMPNGTNQLITSNETVHVRLLGTPNVKLDASTTAASVSSSLPIVAETTQDDYLVGVIGDGSASLLIRTTNSDIIIE
ncbi:MAG: DUF4097 family beta strand repeat-containing protein [Chloroflexota bacterium]|nr:DUF4097 family beta strand repeat-containing protein [Chloroflexota bacterium]